MGDFNARLGKGGDINQEECTGKFGLETRDERGDVMGSS